MDGCGGSPMPAEYGREPAGARPSTLCSTSLYDLDGRPNSPTMVPVGWRVWLRLSQRLFYRLAGKAAADLKLARMAMLLDGPDGQRTREILSIPSRGCAVLTKCGWMGTARCVG